MRFLRQDRIENRRMQSEPFELMGCRAPAGLEPVALIHLATPARTDFCIAKICEREELKSDSSQYTKFVKQILWNKAGFLHGTIINNY